MAKLRITGVKSTQRKLQRVLRDNFKQLGRDGVKILRRNTHKITGLLARSFRVAKANSTGVDWENLTTYFEIEDQYHPEPLKKSAKQIERLGNKIFKRNKRV